MSPDTTTVPAADSFADALKGFGPIGVAAMLVIVATGPMFEPLGGILALAWAWRSRTPWWEIGYVRPRRWVRTVASGVVLGIALKLVLKAIVMPMLGAPAINPVYHYLAGNRQALPGMLFTVTVGAAFAEETVFRGFLFERLGKLLGRTIAAKTAIVLFTSALFGLIHYPGQGLAGAQQATITGLSFGTIFAVTGRLWMPIIAHAAFDVAAVLIIYWDLEASVARFVFQ